MSNANFSKNAPFSQSLKLNISKTVECGSRSSLTFLKIKTRITSLPNFKDFYDVITEIKGFHLNSTFSLLENESGNWKALLWESNINATNLDKFWFYRPYRFLQILFRNLSGIIIKQQENNRSFRPPSKSPNKLKKIIYLRFKKKYHVWRIFIWVNKFMSLFRHIYQSVFSF